MQKTTYRVAITALVFLTAFGCARTADSGSKAATAPTSPDGTVYGFAEAIQEYRIEDIWKFFLPEGYKNDLDELTKLFVEKMDPAVYDRAFALVMRAIEVLDDQKEIILASETFKSTGADAEEIREGLSNSHIFTDALKTSEVATVEGLRTINWEQFLADTASPMIEQAAAIESKHGNPFSELATIKVETLEATEDTATLLISTKEHEPEKVKMVRVGGRWIPADMAKEWPDFVKDARQGLAELTPETMAAQKTQAMMFLGMVEGLIQQIASFETSEEFDAGFGQMLDPWLGGGMGMAPDEKEEWSYEEEPESVEQ